MKKKILGMSIPFSIGVVGVCVLGIIIGSFCDYNINKAIANPTNIGKFFATYGSYFSYCLYPAAGMCLYKALIKKTNLKFLAWVLLVVSYFMAVYYSNSYNGSKVRELLSFISESNGLVSLLSWLFWVVLYAWVPLVMYYIVDDTNPTELIIVGATILIAGIVADNVNLWLKQVASRPRYKYLITLEDPLSEFRNWWQWVPNKAGSNDNFKSWPSGNMTIACMMFALPLLSNIIKKSNNKVNLVCFIIAALFVGLYGYNRMHMTNHFLSDVCFGTLITYIIFCIVNIGFNKIKE